MMLRGYRCCLSAIYRIDTWSKQHRACLACVFFIMLVGLCYLIFVDKSEIRFGKDENPNIVSWLPGLPESMSFLRLHLDIRRIVNRKLLNMTTEVDDIGVINPHPFRYIINPGRCKFKNHDVRPVLVIVKSAVRNVFLRHAIRTTWGNISEDNVKIVFMLGRNTSNDQQRTIDLEAAKYNDIVQQDFIDADFNNTLKTILSFKWATQYCENAQFVLFVDDDFVIDLPKILMYIYSIPEVDAETLFIGHRIIQPVVRDKRSKWALPLEVFPYKYWPPYLAGGTYLASMQVAKKFTCAFPYIQVLVKTDGWLGIVAMNVGINPQDNIFFHNNGRYAHLALVYQCCHTQKEMLHFWWQYNQKKSFRFWTPG
ncbi:beta-1,3-galactosyltransferase brn-like [Mizuhopecten yessoensis]|nr:beta-1,3-galactosyltransferase brn-like [Mizuhopecten yessoensis]